jgi:hypothetical protein
MNADYVKAALLQYCEANRLLAVLEASTPSRRFDLWWMKPSQRKQDTVGIEIKVSRADFVADKKWPHYLGYCEKFYFACPEGLIQPDELAPGVGLIWVHESGATSFQRGAKKRPIDQENLKRMLCRVIMKMHFKPVNKESNRG